MVSNQNLPTYPIISSSSGWPWIAKKKRHLFSPTVTHGFTQILGSTVSKRGTTGHEIPHETPSGMSFREHRRLVWYAILNNLPKQLWEMVCPSLLSNQPVRRVISLLIGILYIYTIIPNWYLLISTHKLGWVACRIPVGFAKAQGMWRFCHHSVELSKITINV